MKRFDLNSLREGAGPDCPSDLKFDRHVAGERDAALEAHCAGCTTCKARLEERQRGWAATPIDPRPVLAAIRRAESEPAPAGAWWKRLLPIFAVALAAVVIVFVTRGEERDVTRLKGSAALKVFRFEQGHSREVSSGSQFSPGDRLRFVVDLPSAGAISVIGVDARRTMYVAWPPPTGTEASFRNAGMGIELPGAVALDESPGPETLFLVHCPGRETPPVCTVGASGPPECGAGCSLSAFEVNKK